MGNTTNYLIIMLGIQLVFGLVAMGIQSVNPDSTLLLGNKLFNVDNNALMSETDNTTGIRMYKFNYSSTGLSSLGDTAIVETSDFKVPDWTRSSNNWLNTGLTAAGGAAKTIINFVGAPYTIMVSADLDPDLSALVGVFWGILSTFILANWLFGRDT